MTAPRILGVGEEPPPISDGDSPQPTRRTSTGDRKRKGKSAGERFKVLNAFVDFSLAELGRVEICVWLILYPDTRDGTARMSYDDLARRAGCARRSVARAVRQLERLVLLRIVHRGGLRRARRATASGRW
jgi:AraC-like DNA-binding protein